MFTLSMTDFTGNTKTVSMTANELGFDGDYERLQRMADNVAQKQSSTVEILENNERVAYSSLFNTVG